MYWILGALGVGICVALQPAINSAWRPQVGIGPVLVVNVIVSSALMIGAAFYWPEHRRWDLLFNARPDFYLGGVFGALIVIGGLLVFPRLGAATALTLIILGQLAFGVLIDHYGWYNTPQTPVSSMRLLGIGLVIAGFLLVRRG